MAAAKPHAHGVIVERARGSDAGCLRARPSEPPTERASRGMALLGRGRLLGRALRVDRVCGLALRRAADVLVAGVRRERQMLGRDVDPHVGAVAVVGVVYEVGVGDLVGVADVSPKVGHQMAALGIVVVAGQKVHYERLTLPKMYS